MTPTDDPTPCNPSKTWLAPAKLNLFLHILGRRSDGYHQLQTLFELVDLHDELTFTTNDAGRIELVNHTAPWPADSDLTVRAARLLQPHADSRVNRQPGIEPGGKPGVEIEIRKRIPAGAGLGGGSSDAATTLLALNHYWGVGLNQDQLAKLGLQLGADVPVFIYGKSAWAEGVGEQLTGVELPHSWYLIVVPECHVNTAEVFAAEELTRNSLPITIRDYLNGSETAWADTCGNDCLAVTLAQYPPVFSAYNLLKRWHNPRLSGTGGALFCQFSSAEEARSLQQKLPEDLRSYLVQSIEHPHRQSD